MKRATFDLGHRTQHIGDNNALQSTCFVHFVVSITSPCPAAKGLLYHDIFHSTLLHAAIKIAVPITARVSPHHRATWANSNRNLCDIRTPTSN